MTSQVTYQPSEEADPNFIVLTFDLEMERKMSFTSYILTLPCIFLACLTLVVFWLPAERPDRTSLGRYYSRKQCLWKIQVTSHEM